ncbi:MAG: tRNA pseudouridine synthase A [Eubacteriales bacterium SKADARSKE-1]|nr:tRNA pseudouridine synthase A [Eubacteriales bacterium SKADARSKE-1]
MKNILLTLSYDGKNYHGWQVQENAVTVQEEFQKTLKKVLNEEPNIKGCSRTDSKVHANMYCVSMKTESNIPLNKLPVVLNKYLPNDIAVKRAVEVSPDFHARYSCIGKEYIYKIWNDNIRNPFLDGYAFHYWYPLDIDLLNEAASYFIGTYDFTSFCTLDKRRSGNMVRTIKNFKVVRENELVTLIVQADGFLYNMVRIMVGTLLQVACKRIRPEDVKSILLAKDRSKAGPTAVPYGLYLNRVFYKGEKL